jgi:hypothetical protein
MAGAGETLKPAPDNGQGTYAGSITAADPTMLGRITRIGAVSTCPVQKICPGVYTATTSYRYHQHNFVNSTTTTCISVRLDASGCGDTSHYVFPVAYVGTFNPADLCANYAGDPAESSLTPQEFTVNVPIGSAFTIVVGEVFGSGCPSYTLTLTAEGANGLARADFNADGISDFVLQSATGDVAVWRMTAWSILSGAVLGNPGGGWRVVATGDLDAAGSADIVLQNSSTGAVAIWHMAGPVIIAGGIIGTPGSAWQLVRAGDFNGDGKSDLVLRNSGTGAVALWLMNGYTITKGVVLGTPGVEWLVAATGDFNYDGALDLLLQNQLTGDLAEWQMSVSGDSIAAGAIIDAPLGWKVIASGDFDSDAEPELVLQSTAYDVAIWELDGFTVTAGYGLGAPSGWSVLGTVESDLDGKSDIVLRHPATGEIAIWDMKGTTIEQGYSIGSPGAYYWPTVN